MNPISYRPKSLLYSDVIVTVVSTIAIDGLVFHKPVVLFSFEPKDGLSDTIGKFSTNPHFKKFLDSGLIATGHNKLEFIEYLNTYLKDPTADKEKRDQLALRYAYRLDGKSAERVADCLLRVLST
ncbi:MAG: hypothetical protein EXS51_04445 [Candidatus Taylorbacteria bacterium]|nr:hypothetical protein [Candidatus Taylorbacteria bacterium]